MKIAFLTILYLMIGLSYAIGFDGGPRGYLQSHRDFVPTALFWPFGIAVDLGEWSGEQARMRGQQERERERACG